MKSFVFSLISAAILFALAPVANATDVADSVWGRWDKGGSPYYVVDEIWVPSDSTLIIDSGVEVIFWGNFKFIIEANATLKAHGVAGDSVIFSTPWEEAGWGGLRFMSASSACSLAYCIIKHGNAAGTGEDANGGAIYCSNSNPYILHCSIDSCSASGNGGGIYCTSSHATIQNCLIVRCTSVRKGGGIYCEENSNPTISGNTIAGNRAPTLREDGGGIYCKNSNPIINGNTISGNYADGNGSGILCIDNSNPMISENTIRGNSVRLFNGGGIFCDNSSPTIVYNTIIENSAGGWNGQSGGGICCRYSSPLISGNTISGNKATDTGCVGGGISCYYSSPTINGNTIIGNSANSYGGGIFCEPNSNPDIDDNEINENTSDKGGGLACDGYSSANLLRNNTFYGNTASTQGGGIYLTNSTLRIVNSIFWDNTASDGDQIYLGHASAALIAYSDVQDGWPGEGNINADPQFVLPDRRDYRLFWGSPCIDTGYPDFLDPDGTRSDMGAHPFDQSHPLTIYLSPDTTVVVRHEKLGVTYTVINIEPNPWTFYLQTDVYLPNGKPYPGNPIVGPMEVTLQGEQTKQKRIRHSVPGKAPLGIYTYESTISTSVNDIIDQDSFEFEVVKQE
jgi:predicted outer membrane repeat protein